MTYDLIIIGAGSAGFSAYKEAIQHTDNLLIINDGPWDTMCARVGCMPSKVLISSANQLHDAQTLEKVGIKATVQADTSQVMRHVRTLRDSFTAATKKQADSWKAEHKISGKAQFIDAHTVQVNGKTYRSKSFVIAVGSTPKINQEWQTELKERFLTSDTIFELPQLPKSMAVVGSGVIALELAQAMQRLGVNVTVFARSQQLGSLTDPNLQELAQKEISKELNILFETLPQQVKRTEAGVEIIYGSNTITIDYLLNATGRTSYLTTLRLENINTDYKDIKKLPLHPQTKQLDKLPIFIVGDAYPTLPVQHEASQEGKLAVQNCFGKVKSITSLTPLTITFSSPEMATCGKTYQQLKDENIKFVTGTASYEDQGRAKVLGKNKGALKIYANPSNGIILGAEIFVEHAEHLAHLLAWSMTDHATVDALLEQPFYHPTLQEGIRTALRDLKQQIQ